MTPAVRLRKRDAGHFTAPCTALSSRFLECPTITYRIPPPYLTRRAVESCSTGTSLHLNMYNPILNIVSTRFWRVSRVTTIGGPFSPLRRNPLSFAKYSILSCDSEVHGCERELPEHRKYQSNFEFGFRLEESSMVSSASQLFK
jgi:hypothetical protein